MLPQTFVTNAHIGVDVDAQAIRDASDAVVISTGATWPRDLRIPHCDADGIHFAMEFLQVRRGAPNLSRSFSTKRVI
jgi:glutamate synthase (NADPH/NADH)